MNCQITPRDERIEALPEKPGWMAQFRRFGALGLTALLFGAGFGCGKQAEPPPPLPRRIVERRAPPPLPPAPLDEVEVQLAPTPEETPTLAGTDGLQYQNFWIREVPWSVNIVKIDRSRADWEFTTTLGRGRNLGLSPLSGQIDAISPEIGLPVAAVNGDFYATEHEPYSGDPRGLQIMRGELISSPIGKTAFWIDPDGNPVMGDVRSEMRVRWPDGRTTSFGLNEQRGSHEAVLYTPRAGSSTRASGGRELVLEHSGEGSWLPLAPGETYSARIKSVRETGNTRLTGDYMVLSLGPALLSRVPKVSEGDLLQIATTTTPDLRGVQTAIGGGPVLLRGGKLQSTPVNKAQQRHPRSAMGWNDEHFFLMQVDGRQHGFSMGMTLPEVGTYLARQGCKEAMNLDGGGSSELWFEGRVVNRPCFGYERNTANGLVVIRKQKLAAR